MMQKVFDITNRYIILATPLLLFSLFSSVYLVASINSGKLISIFIAAVVFILMISAFLAGWLKMVKTAVENQDADDAYMLMKEFTPGVGEFFLSTTVAVLIMSFLFGIMMVGTYFLGSHFIGNPDISAEALANAMRNTAELKSLLLSLSTEQLVKLNLWNFLLMGMMLITYLLIFLYLPALFFKNKNPIVAFGISIKDLFSKKFFMTVGVFLLIVVTNSIISVFTTLFSANFVLHFLMTLMNYYFIVLVAVGEFYYYYQNFVLSNIGQNIDIEV